MTEPELYALADAAQNARFAYRAFPEKRHEILPVAERVAIDIEARRLLDDSVRAQDAYENALEAYIAAQP